MRSKRGSLSLWNKIFFDALPEAAGKSARSGRSTSQEQRLSREGPVSHSRGHSLYAGLRRGRLVISGWDCPLPGGNVQQDVCILSRPQHSCSQVPMSPSARSPSLPNGDALRRLIPYHTPNHIRQNMFKTRMLYTETAVAVTAPGAAGAPRPDRLTRPRSLQRRVAGLYVPDPLRRWISSHRGQGAVGDIDDDSVTPSSTAAMGPPGLRLRGHVY